MVITFFDPKIYHKEAGEKTMFDTTLCYIEQDNKYLMLHRIKKKQDINEGKWIGVGGKIEETESPEDCMAREVYEETGLTVIKYRYCGIVTFVSDQYETEYMHLFIIHEFVGKIIDCNEGVLEWVEKKKLSELPHWKGDLIFLSLLADKKVPFFSLKLTYQKDDLVQAILNGRENFVTQRLILRQWMEEDAENLYHYAKDPEIGSATGFPVHTSTENSLEIIKDVLSASEMYAIVRHDTNEAIGSIGLEIGTKGIHVRSADEGEIGYWMGKPFWGNGYVPEAVEQILHHGFMDLGLQKIWCGYYDGNEKSKRVQEKCGFIYDHTEENVPRKLLGDQATEHFTCMTREQYLQKKQ